MGCRAVICVFVSKSHEVLCGLDIVRRRTFATRMYEDKRGRSGRLAGERLYAVPDIVKVTAKNTVIKKLSMVYYRKVQCV